MEASSTMEFKTEAALREKGPIIFRKNGPEYHYNALHHIALGYKDKTLHDIAF